jgi:hypothetical protein
MRPKAKHHKNTETITVISKDLIRTLKPHSNNLKTTQSNIIDESVFLRIKVHEFNNYRIMQICPTHNRNSFEKRIWQERKKF